MGISKEDKSSEYRSVETAKATTGDRSGFHVTEKDGKKIFNYVKSKEEVPPVEEVTAAEEVSAVEEVTAAEEVPAVEEVSPVEEIATVEEVSVIEEVPAVEEVAVIEEVPAVEEVSSVEEVIEETVACSEVEEKVETDVNTTTETVEVKEETVPEIVNTIAEKAQEEVQENISVEAEIEITKAPIEEIPPADTTVAAVEDVPVTVVPETTEEVEKTESIIEAEKYLDTIQKEYNNQHEEEYEIINEVLSTGSNCNEPYAAPVSK